MFKVLCALAWLLFGTLSLGGAVRANDTSVGGVGGSWQPMEGEHRDIRMEREWVRLEIGSVEYVTRAHFVFVNSGPAQMVTMGFPETGHGDSSGPENLKTPDVRGFVTEVDGVRVPVKRRGISAEDSSYYKALWVKKVWFERGQRRRVRVAFRTFMGATSARTNIVGYSFTGGNWRGDVAQSTLTLEFRAPGRFLLSGQYKEACHQSKSEPQPIVHRRGPRLQYVWRNWQAQNEFELDYTALLPNAYNEYLNPGNSHIISVAGRVPHDVRRYRMTSCLQESGVMFVSLKEAQEKVTSNLTWIELRGRWMILNAGRFRWAWRFDSRRVTFRDNMAGVRRSMTMPAPPFKMRDEYYVPLRSLVDLAGGSIRLDARTRSVSWKIPRFQPPRNWRRRAGLDVY